ncbi:MAG: thioredoxin-like domain-containing protein [Chloroherpetonaceae bacterium]|nr:thioredoxin-like domain-containing protein [Chloroherpetonaceae bacterium]MDW8438424.1 thioredoxin-like domain-containing protein [Chloroherpetonaceae bacterium]
MKLVAGKFALFCSMLATLSASLAAQGSEVRVSGSVLQFDGKPVKMGNVILTALNGDYESPIANFSVGSDGRYEFPIYGSGFYKIWFAAPNHAIFGAPLVIDSLRDAGARLFITAQLAPYDYKTSFDSVWIIGDWNKFDFETASPMLKQPNGTFIFEVKAERAAYQLLGVTKQKRSVNGTMSDDFLYDGAGDYRSLVVKRGDAPLVIEFNPALLPRTSDSSLPRIAFNARFAHLQELSRLERRYQESLLKAQEGLEKWTKSGGFASNYVCDYGEFPNEMMNAIRNDKLPEVVRQILVAQLLSLPYFKPKNASELLDVAERLLGISYPMWSLYPEAVLNYAKLKGKERELVLRKFAAQTPDRGIELRCVAELALLAKESGDSAKIREVYQGARKTLGDFKEGVLLLQELDPNKPTLEGKPIPPFELKTLDGKKITDKSLRGKYVLLDFWMSWYAPTLAERDFLADAYARFKGKNFEIVSVSFDDKPDDAKAFLRKRPDLKWTQCFAEKRFESDIAKRFRIQSVPFPILIAPDGKTLALGVSLRQYQLAETLSKFLK